MIKLVYNGEAGRFARQLRLIGRIFAAEFKPTPEEIIINAAAAAMKADARGNNNKCSSCSDESAQ